MSVFALLLKDGSTATPSSEQAHRQRKADGQACSEH